MMAAKLIAAAALTTIVTANYQQTVFMNPNDLQACSILDFQLPGRIAFRNSDVYKSETESYWATNQAELSSSCRVTPQDSADLQQTMFYISQVGASFAVKSAGHSVVANTSNIAHGIVIDLEHLDHVTVHADAGVVDVGIGARWSDVYQKLEGTDYGAAGARAGSVGIGGYLLGGGLSPFSGISGWACDSIVLLEVVLANGTILEVDHIHHPDLFMALKGGGSNFGVVSRARLQLFEAHNQLAVAFVQYQGFAFPHVLHAITQYNDMADEDPDAAVSVSIGGRFEGQTPMISAVLSHHQNVLDSKVLAPFFEIDHHLVSHVQLNQLELAKIYDEMNPKGFRQHRSTTTIHNNVDVLTDLVGDYVSELYPHLGSLEGANKQSGLLIQPLTSSHLHSGRTASPNLLGLQNEPSPLLLLSVEMRYSDPSDDKLTHKSISNFMNAADEHAAERNASHRFRYLNYASADQHAFEHLQHDHKLWSKVQAVKQKYDPCDVFGKQMHHPFRLQLPG